MRKTLPRGPALVDHHDALLFQVAHPRDEAALRAAEGELRRIARELKRAAADPRLESSGLPWTDTVTRFSHDMVRRLLVHPACSIDIENYEDPLLDLNAVLRLTLPSTEWNETTAGLANHALLDALGIAPRDRLGFIVQEVGRFDGQPYVKDRLFDALDLFVRVRPRRSQFAKAFNRLPIAAPYFHREPLPRLDPVAWMDRRLPRARRLDDAARASAIDAIRDSLVLTSRETDPATYLDARMLRVFDLERGVAVAIYGMTAERQLPFESYAGFTLFKNGLPVAYGGAWILGERAAFGMNIFEPYRSPGGESGFMMCQVLRVYRQLFTVRWFEVDAHQFGLDNPDGIATGAFWFYYKHGFRPTDAALARRAEAERAKIAARPGYRSSAKTLLAFTGSSVALNFGGPAPLHLFDWTTAITKAITRRFGGDRRAAERAAEERLPRGGEYALLALALGIEGGEALALLRRIARAKPRDLFGYQRLLRAFLKLDQSTPTRKV
jgi:hypothetical protein